jgi:hypothetical protein
LFGIAGGVDETEHQEVDRDSGSGSCGRRSGGEAAEARLGGDLHLHRTLSLVALLATEVRRGRCSAVVPETFELGTPAREILRVRLDEQEQKLAFAPSRKQLVQWAAGGPQEGGKQLKTTATIERRISRSFGVLGPPIRMACALAVFEPTRIWCARACGGTA